MKHITAEVSLKILHIQSSMVSTQTCEKEINIAESTRIRETLVVACSVQRLTSNLEPKT